MQIQPKLSLILDTRKAIANGDFPAKLRVTFRIIVKSKPKWVAHMLKTGVYCDDKTFSVISDFKKEPKSEERKKMWQTLKDNFAKAENIISTTKHISPEALADQYYGAGGYNDLAGLFDAYETPSVGTRNIYRCAKSSFKQYNGEHIAIGSINEQWLKKYVEWGRKNGLSDTFLSMNLRCLRSVMNNAVAKKKITADLYPFGKHGFKIPDATGVKKALSEEQKNSLLKYETENEEVQEAVDFWKLSYYLYGLNGADILALRHSNISDDIITINRAKTQTKLVIPVHKEARRIIKRYGQRTLNLNDYIFPIYKGSDSEQIKFYKKNKFNKQINSGLKLAGEKSKIKDLTWYSARHTFATIMRNKGIPTQLIQVMMGHTTERTTQIYLDSINIDKLKKASAML